jgi:NitT/TauT family transport system ATP-binding protein
MPGAETLSVDIREKRFGTIPVLGGLRFAASPGEFLAVLAPSGTGKTTALRILLGLDTAFSGTVTRPGGRVGAVFQEPCLLPWMDVAANLRLAAPGLSQGDVAALLADMDLADVAAYLPRQISLGMARRVAIARALAVSPSLMVLDEPFTSLDARLAARLAGVVASRARQAVVVMATHDLDQALVVASRVLVLAGSPAALVEDQPVPAHSQLAPFAAGLRQRHPFLNATG